MKESIDERWIKEEKKERRKRGGRERKWKKRDGKGEGTARGRRC